MTNNVAKALSSLLIGLVGVSIGAAPAQATVMTPPTLTAITSGVPSTSDGSYSGVSIVATQIRACPSSVVASTGFSTILTTSGCRSLTSDTTTNVKPTDLSTAFINLGSSPFPSYAPEISNYPNVVFVVQLSDGTAAWTNSILYSGSGSSSASEEETPAQVPSYTGPKISSLNLTSVAPGGSLVATGKKLDQIQSASIGGKAAALTYSANGLAITVPADLAPGTYDLVMQTSYGSLTQLNAVVVKTKPKVSSFTLKGTGSELGSDLASEIKAIGSMYSADYSKIHCLVNTTDETAAAIATKACSLLKTGSLSAATTLTTLKSTFKGSGFWLRIYVAG